MSRTVRTLAALLAALLLLAACGGREDREEQDFVLYYLLEGEPVHGSALDWEPYPGEADPGPEELLTALLAGPAQEGLASPFPRGVSLLSWDWDEEEPGVLRITLSEQYGALTDISLTLADYCIVLTLSQLEEVEGVEIRSGGHSAGYRSHQTLRADEALLWDSSIVQAELGEQEAS